MMSENHICAAAKAMAQTYTTGSVPLYGKKLRLPDRERGFFDKTDAHDPSIVNRENSAVPGTPAEGKAQYGGGTAREFHSLPRKCAAQYAIVYATVYRTGTFFASPFGSVRKTYLRYRRS